MPRKTIEELEEQYENLSVYEKSFYEEGLHYIAGIDEAGRGPLAGPVVAAAVILSPNERILGLNDSKKLTAKMRDKLYDEIKQKALAYAVCEVSPEEIDEINILNATKKCMKMCVDKLSIKPEVLLIDAVKLEGTGIKVEPIIKGDAKSNSIAAASVLAKVTRDRKMVEYDNVYPGYGFASHKGYGTKAHYEAIRKLGFSPIHRKTFLKVIH